MTTTLDRRQLLRMAAAAALMLPLTALPAAAETLRVWGPEQYTQDEVRALWDELDAKFEAMHPGVTVEHMQPTGTINDGAVQAAIQSGVGPDVLLTNSGVGRVGIVARANLIQPLTEAYAEHGWGERLYPWLYADLQRQFDGALYEWPDGLDAIGLWYHADVMAEHGWELPDSYSGMLELFDEIKEAGLFPLMVGPRSNFNGGHLFGQILQATAGRDVVGDVLYTKEPWTHEAMVAGATRLQELVERGHIPREAVGMNLDEASRLWFTKRAVFFVAGPWFTNNARSAGFDLTNAAYAPMPSDLESESMPTGGIGWSWMVPTNARNPDLALAWVDFITSDEAMLTRARHPTSWMVYPRELPPFEPAIAALNDVYTAATEKGIGYNPSVYMPGNVLDTYYQVIQGLIGDQVSPEEAMRLMQEAQDAAG